MSRLTNAIASFAQALGGPGLLLVSFLDSSFIPLPSVTDILILYFVAEHPARWLYYAGLSTAGSVAGCYVLFAIAKKGGEALLKRRYSDAHLAKRAETFRRYGLFTVLVPSILPPPTPFKIFVLLAGMTRVRTGTFLLAMVIGRGFRYGGEALLAARYGPQAREFIMGNLAKASIWLAVTVAVGGGAYVLWRRRADRMSRQRP